MLDRRNFLAGVSATAALSATGANAKGTPKGSLIFDAMGELRTTYDVALLNEIRASGLNAITVTLTDPKVFEEQAYEEGKAAVVEHDEYIAKHPDLLIKATKTADLDRAMRENKIAVYYLFQTSTQFGRDINRVQEFYDAGVRSSQLTYNYQNWAGAGCKELRGSGVTEFGRKLINKMNEVGMLIDLSHANEKTMLDAIEMSSKPIVISHTCCQAVYPNIRNTSDKVLKAMAAKGGVVGICQMRPFLTDKRPDVALPAYFDHIDHAVNTIGVEHVAIGSDRDHRVITMTDEYIAELAAEEGDNFHIEDWPLFIDALNGPRRMEVIWDGLKKRKYSHSDIEKIMGTNLKRLYKETIG
ncbi:dipeptidase [Hyphococcus sp. DH-69]|uniref:dipeptidase n=1 Tax=Hyphococcus formosus TaxID=3143534 RepID=UPI00398B70D6